MAQFIPNQAFSESQFVFSRLCAEFEKTSGLLSQNIKNLIEVYVENANQYLHKHENDMKEQISLILETSEQLFSHEMGEDILKRIERELIHLNELFKCTISINTNTTVFPQLTENFYSECNQSLKSPEYPKSNSLAEVLKEKMEDAKILVHNRTCEIRHLYDQYKNMAEELRMKWRYTLENIQQH
ncbi:hypothetical protein FOCC_FOCC011500 [Frankliniella occidentalis]|nr:hypothetical protein FOCC_FOCC011500 [Frankliniella occidentalis]